jgi:hypothetical protein
MLRVNPRERPDAAHLCQVVEELRPLPEEVGEVDQQVEIDSQTDDPLLNTILLPKDLKLLEVNLPRANYQTKSRSRIHESHVLEGKSAKLKSSSRSLSRPSRSQIKLQIRRRTTAAEHFHQRSERER